MVINLEQKKIKTKLVENHFDLRLVLNYNIDMQKKFPSEWWIKQVSEFAIHSNNLFITIRVFSG